MTHKFPHLCSPITIEGRTFSNRMFSAPMGGTDITNDGCIGPKSTAFYELRAKGGAAAVTVSECMVHPETDGSHAYHLDTTILNSLAAAMMTEATMMVAMTMEAMMIPEITVMIM